MKALADCKWKVKIICSLGVGEYEYYWWADLTKRDTKAVGFNLDYNGNAEDIHSPYFETEKKCINHWERFAKLNGYKNWKYV